MDIGASERCYCVKDTPWGIEEEVHLNDYEDITEARHRIGHFITQVYHQKRPHSALGYLTPIEFPMYNPVTSGLIICQLVFRLSFYFNTLSRR